MRRAYYLTGDEVNRSLADELARREGLEIAALGPRDPLPLEGVLICDWDSLGDEPRQRVLSQGSEKVLLALHSYDLDFQRQRNFVWRQRLVVFRRLDGRLFADSALAAKAA